MMEKGICISCMGDIMPGGVLHYEKNDAFCSEKLLQELNKADVRVATLETAIGDSPDFDPEKMKREKDVIYCPTENLHRLLSLNINVVSLANNHAWDLGLSGIEHTKLELDKLGIKYCGAGKDLNEAQSPAVLTVNGKTVAFIAYCDNKPGTCGYIPEATDSTPGINVLNEQNIYDNIVSCKSRYDYLFVMMHWGKEYYYYPTPEVNRLAKKMIDWGADGIIGSHSHQIQPVVFHHDRPIIFSLGNFFFPDRFITSPRSTFYPELKPDLEEYPVTYGYPMVDKPTLKIWKQVARKGLVVFLTFTGNTIEAKKIITCLDNHSHLDISKEKVPLLFSISRLLVKMPCYSQLFFFMRGCRYIRKKIKGEI